MWEICTWQKKLKFVDQKMVFEKINNQKTCLSVLKALIRLHLLASTIVNLNL